MFADYKTPSDQLEELRKMGLLFDEEEEAKDFLFLVDPHRLKGYLGPFMDQGKFIDGTSFRVLMSAYNRDQEVRHGLSLFLEKIELRFKYAYCLEFSKAHGKTGYLDPSFFSDAAKHRGVLDKADKQRSSLANHDAAFRYYADDGSPIDLPIWDFVELLTVKDVTDLYIISEKSLKKEIALYFGLTMKDRDMILGDSMRRLTFLRNMCAHGRRLFNHAFSRKPFLSKKEKRLLPKRVGGFSPASYLFGYILLLRRLLTKDDLQNFKCMLIEITRKYPSINMDGYGFPSNWEQVL